MQMQDPIEGALRLILYIYIIQEVNTCTKRLQKYSHCCLFA